MKTGRVKIRDISMKEVMDKICEVHNIELTDDFAEGFKRAWIYKEIEREGWEISSKHWRKKYEDG